MSKKHAVKKIILTSVAAGTAYAITNKIKTKNEKKDQHDLYDTPPSPTIKNGSAYFVGGGLGSLAGAAYLIRDCGYKGDHIHIFEGLPVLGGSNDGCGDAVNGFICRGGRMLNEETYENFWELFSDIPSLECPERSVTDEILNFDHAHPTCAKGRLIDKNGMILDVKSMGFNNKDRMLLGKLMITPERDLDNLSIIDWFKNSQHFFETNFWYMWQTTFAFQKWSSVFELKRYMERMIAEFPRIDTLEGVTRTPYNQYESVILPLKTYLEKSGVDFQTHTVVTDIDFQDGYGITAKRIHLNNQGVDNIIDMLPDDICIMTNACMTDSTTLGNKSEPPEYSPNKPISDELWHKIASKKPNLGNPKPFFERPDQTNWESFTVTCKGNKFLKLIEHYSGNIPGNGALMTFKDSNWLMSIVVAAQPHFKNQPLDTTIFWGYGLYTDKVGNYIKKPMRDCTGDELLVELVHQLHFEDKLEEIIESVINIIPCMMPYVGAQLQPRAMSDRPAVIPEGSTNFAMISQFVEMPEDIVFTEEYSVRAARTAIYGLMGINKPICPVTSYKKNPKVLLAALKTTFS